MPVSKEYILNDQTELRKDHEKLAAEVRSLQESINSKKETS